MSDRVDPRVSTDLAPEAPGSGPKSRSRSPVAPMTPCARIVCFWCVLNGVRTVEKCPIYGP